MFEDVDTTAQEIFRTICNEQQIGPNSLCLCGSTKILSECCDSKNGTDMIFAKSGFTDAMRFANSQGGLINGLPRSIAGRFLEASQERFLCLFPGCVSQPVYCHLTPENILSRAFGGQCLSWQQRKKPGGSEFSITGIGSAEAEPVFCGFHDNHLFTSIDQLPSTISSSPELQFRLAFKVVAFEMRKTQTLIGVDLQVEIFRPHIPGASILPASKGGKVKNNWTLLYEQYTRLKILHKLVQDATHALQEQRWEWFSYCSRSIPCDDRLFFAGIINPSHDLLGRRLNCGTTPICLVCNIMAMNGRVLFFLAAPDDQSSQAYAGLFQQILDADEQIVLWIACKIMTFASQKPLLPVNHKFKEQRLPLVTTQRQLSAECLKKSSSYGFKLYDPKHTLPFFENLKFPA